MAEICEKCSEGILCVYSFQLLLDVSIHSVYFIGIWVTWYACITCSICITCRYRIRFWSFVLIFIRLPNLLILRYIVILISVRTFLMKFFIISFFVSISVFRKWISSSRFAIILLSTSVLCSSRLYGFIFCLISCCIKLHTSFFISFSKMSLIFWYLVFLYEKSVASGSVSLNMKESIWSGTLFKELSVFTFFSTIWVFVIVRIGVWESVTSVLSSAY